MSEPGETKQCPFCRESIKQVAIKCRFCGQYLDGRLPDGESADLVTKMLLPVGRSGWAIAAGYLGLLSCFPFVGLVFGIAAVLTGLKGRQEIRGNPGLGGTGRAVFGIVLGGLCILWNALLIALFLLDVSRGRH
jgi:hypothetical protein